MFHATGTGGGAMEGLIDSGFLTGVLDITTTELCDELVGGVLAAGPDRLEAAGRAGHPQVVSLGALDMVNFGARDTVPPQFEERNLYVHNPSVTLMRTTAEECRRARADHRGQARRRATRPGGAVLAAQGCFDDRRPRAAVPRPGRRRGPVRGAARRISRTTWSCIELELDINDPSSRRRWPTSSSSTSRSAARDRRRGARSACARRSPPAA